MANIIALSLMLARPDPGPDASFTVCPSPAVSCFSLAEYRPEPFSMTMTLVEAHIPRELWPEFMNVAWCESRFNPTAVGDNGESKGLYQIHWPLWAEWARQNHFGEFPAEAWDDPIANARLAYLIGQYYDMPRYGERWHQWTTNPDWRACGTWQNE